MAQDVRLLPSGYAQSPEKGQMGMIRDVRHSGESVRVREYTFRFLLQPTQSAQGIKMNLTRRRQTILVYLLLPFIVSAQRCHAGQDQTGGKGAAHSETGSIVIQP